MNLIFRSLIAHTLSLNRYHHQFIYSHRNVSFAILCGKHTSSQRLVINYA